MLRKQKPGSKGGCTRGRRISALKRTEEQITSPKRVFLSLLPFTPPGHLGLRYQTKMLMRLYDTMPEEGDGE